MDDDFHNPVLLEAVLEGLAPEPGGCYADGTIGGGGHAYAILEQSTRGGWLLGCDGDPEALAVAESRLQRFQGRFELRRGNFVEVFAAESQGAFDGVLLDLGVSSHQLEQPERGFSFQKEGPLDMRMNPDNSTTAADLVNQMPIKELEGIFRDYGEERRAGRIAQAIGERRRQAPIRSTTELAELVRRVNPQRGSKIHPATRVFQALRIAVNRELESLEQGLHAAWGVLKQGGRLAIITFHSLEARRVKQFGKRLARPYTVTGPVDRPEWRAPAEPDLEWVTKKAVMPSAEEIRSNPRARSAQLRVFKRL